MLFNGLISIQERTEERISELEDFTTDTSKTAKQKRERNRSNIGRNNDLQFSQIHVRHQFTHPQSSENANQNNCLKNYT